MAMQLKTNKNFKTTLKPVKELLDDINEYKKKPDSKYSKDLAEVSTFDPEFGSNLELLKKLRLLLLDCLKVCEGAYRAKPTQGNSYALTNMVAQVKEITDRLEEAVDYNEVVDTVIKEVITPFMDKVVLTLGTVISSELDTYESSERKTYRPVINNIYKKFAAEINTKFSKLHEDITKNILDQVK